MDTNALVARIHVAAVLINNGYHGLDTDGQEHEGCLLYEIGISGVLEIFHEVMTINMKITTKIYAITR